MRYRFATTIHGDFLPESCATLDEGVLECRRIAKRMTPGAERVFCIDAGSVPHLVRGYSENGRPFTWMRDCKHCKGRGFHLNAKTKQRDDCAKCRGDGRVVEATFNG